MARCGLRTTADLIQIHGVLGRLSFLYHADILGLLAMPIEALYYHFSLIKQGMGNEQQSHIHVHH